MKIRVPKIRLSRKVLFISAGMFALLGGSGAAALYVSGDILKSTPSVNHAGGECSTIQTMVLKTPSRRLWLRKYIRMENADGAMRIKTALRVAGLLAKSNAVDLIEVSVLDANGPTTKSAMRGRAIGAEVVIGLKPEYLPDMKEPFIVRYYEGMPTNEGRYYGQRVSLDLEEIRKMMGAMRDVADKHDCTEPEKSEDASSEKGHEKKPDHGETVVSAGHETPSGDDAKPVEHGEDTASEAAADHEAASSEGHAPPAEKEKSLLDSALGLIGLGGSEAPSEAEHEASAESDDSHAVADDAIEPAPAVDEHGAENGEMHDKPDAEDAHGDAVDDPVPSHDEQSAPAEKTDESTHAKADNHAAVEDHAETPPQADEKASSH